MAKENSDKEIISFQVPIDQGYYDLSKEERREFLRALLGSMSPNSEVRSAAEAQANKYKKKIK